MVSRSVPKYKEVQNDIISLSLNYINDNSKILDLGCSTGSLLLDLSKSSKKKNLKFLGIDSSPNMIDIANKKILRSKTKNNFEFICSDFLKFKTSEKFSIIFMNYTLQFVRPLERQKLVNKIYKLLSKNGIFIICEKILSKNSIFNRQFIDIYHNYKINQGYSNTEIQKKREALENILVPFKLEENMSMLNKSGFRENEVFFKWFNWVGIISRK
jgi:tRNA (cmo5U34)-methyltransferase